VKGRGPFAHWAAASAVAAAIASVACVRAEHRAAGADEAPPRPAAVADDRAIAPVGENPPPVMEPVLVPPSEGATDLSLEQAALLALRGNRELQVRQLTPVIAGTFERIERGRYDPELFAEMGYGEERASEVDRATGTQFGVEADDSLINAGVRQELSLGTTLDASVRQTRDISNRTPEQQVARLGLSVTQSLLRGLGPSVNLASVRQAELDTLASRYELQGFTEALLAETEIAYWRYVLAQLEIEIFEQSLAVARQQRDEVELRIDVGILPQVEAAAARAEVARNEQGLIDARSLVEADRLRLLRLINPGPRGQLDFRINAVSEPAIEAEPITDVADRLALAEQSRPDLREAELRVKQNRLETVVTRNGLLPQLDLFVALGKTGYADTFSESFHALGDQRTYDFRAGVRLSHFLGNRAAEGHDVAARASERQATEAVANLRQLVHLDVRLAINEVERTRQQIDASRVTRMLQEETLSAEKERFDVGSSTALQVVQAQRDLLAARIAEVEAIVNYRIALVNLYSAEGSLLARRGLALAADGVP
jgi:outer membrane protein TolC